MALTKADFAEGLFDELGIDKREAKAMVDLFFEEIKSSLEQGKPVKILVVPHVDIHGRAGYEIHS